MKKILLLNTPVRLASDASFFPVGLGYIATTIKKSNRPFEIIDINLNRFSDEQVTELVRNSNADYIGITGMAIQFGLVCTYAKIAKQVLPDCKVIVGGRVTTVPDMLLAHKEIDYCVLLDGEDTIVELLSCLDIGNDPIKSNIPGLAALSGGDIIRTQVRKYEKNLDRFGALDYYLWDVNRYIENQVNTNAHRGGNNRRSLNMISSRGCPFRCNFCGEDGNTLRYRSIPSIFDEIDHVIEEFDIEHIHFSDGLFVFSEKRINEFCSEYLRRGETFTWSGNSRVDITTDDLLLTVKAAGCIFLSYGFESGSQKMLDVMNKKTRVEQNAKAIKLHRKHNVFISSSFIFGAPGDSYRTMAETARFITKYQFQPSAINFMMVFPGTPDWRHALATGAIKDPLQYLESMAQEVKKMRYSNLKPIVNMTEMNDWLYFAWGKLLQMYVKMSLSFGRARTYYNQNGISQTIYRTFREFFNK